MTDDIICGEPLHPRVCTVLPLEGYRLLLTFTNGERRIFEMNRILDLEVFCPLRNKSLFNLARVEGGTVAWPNGIDYCPDTAYEESILLEEDTL